MDFYWTTLIGLVVGLLAKDHSQGHRVYWLPALLGIAGATLGYLVGIWAGWTRSGQPMAYGAAVVGAWIVLAGFNTERQLRNR
jgi:uncharacterized membrane protein YeaQ/YmgE (transglycosylase-associated protein family)